MAKSASLIFISSFGGVHAVPRVVCFMRRRLLLQRVHIMMYPCFWCVGINACVRTCAPPHIHGRILGCSHTYSLSFPLSPFLDWQTEYKFSHAFYSALFTVSTALEHTYIHKLTNKTKQNKNKNKNKTPEPRSSQERGVCLPFVVLCMLAHAFSV